jgi:hypothetical protein
MSGRTRVAALLVMPIVTLIVTLSGCASIPGSGPVLSGPAIEADPRAGMVQVGGYSPAPGATPAGIVSGFLQAAVGFSSDHQVARSFLTPQRRLAWRPDAEVTVYPRSSLLKVKEIGAKPAPAVTGTATPAATATATATASAKSDSDSGRSSADVRDRAEVTRVTVTTPIEAQIDRDGRYQLAPPGKTITATFGLIRIGGEWRINALADGILIGAVDFGVTFRPFPVYFGDPTGRYLVPDVHWFPGVTDTPSAAELPTALVRMLLAGPPPWLQGAVVTGAPANTKMAVAAVVVTDDVATVDLTDEVRAADTRARQLLASQLQATLGQFGSVQITVRGLAFDVPAGSSDTSDPSQPQGQPVADPRVDVRPVLIDAKGRLARLENGVPKAVAGVGGLAVPGANRPAVSLDSSAYAVLNADRSKLLLQLPGAQVVTVLSSAALTAPSFDPSGAIWTAPGANAGFVYASATDSRPVKVKAPWLKGADVVSLRMSREGTRAVVAVQVDGHAHLLLAGVVRDANGVPLSLTQPPPDLFPALETVNDLAWVDESHVVALGRRNGASGQGPWVVQIGGDIEAAKTSLSGAESITAGNGELSVMAGTADKGILARSGALWKPVSRGRWPAFPG